MSRLTAHAAVAAMAAALVAAGGARPSTAAETKWRASLALGAIYDRNVYFTPDDDAQGPRSSSGGSAAADLGFTSTTPRSELSLGYKPSYRYYSKETEANNLQHFLSLHWKTALSEKSTLTIGEDAGYTAESDNFADRGVNQAFTAGPRTRQIRSATAFGLASRLSPRWTLSTDYNYRLLSNGSLRDDPALTTGACCVAGGSSCIVATADECQSQGGAYQGNGTTCAPTACTLGAPAVPVSTVTAAFDEQAHAANVGAAYQVTPASSLGARAGYTLIRYEEDLFGSSVRRTTSIGASVTYGWTIGERLSFAAALGGYRSRDSAGTAEPSSVPGAVPTRFDSKSTTDVSAEVSLSRNDVRGTLTAGLTRGLSSFDGLGRVTTVDADNDGTLDDTNGDGTADVVIEPLGSSTATTLYGSYNYRLGQRSNVTLAANATRREESAGGGTLTAVGAGGSYGLRFAPWGGVQAGYTYARQMASGSSDLQGREFTNNTALLGLFVSTPW